MSEIKHAPSSKISVINSENHPEFALNENINALVVLKNETITHYTQENTDITSALVDLKWKNRREIYPMRFKEEVYGAVLSEIIAAHPHLKQTIIARLEEKYQQIRADEAQTLSITRGLIEGSYKTPNL